MRTGSVWNVGIPLGALPEQMDGRFAYLLEVNEKNEYDVCCALTDILCYGHGSVYDQLAEGMQDTVRAISMLMLRIRNMRK